MTQILFLSVVIAAAPPSTWPSFRGAGDSISDAQNLPLKWSDDTGVAWKVKLPGYGQSSPVIWHERVIVTSTDGPNKETATVACFDTQSGQQLWTKDFRSSQTAKVSNYVSRAAPTPVVDDDRVYVFFETGNLAALTHDGEIVWQRSLTEDYGKFLGNHGLGGSIAITENALVVLVDHDGPSYLLAVDKATGETIWKQDRPKRVSWSSPISAGDEIIVSSNGVCEAIDAKTGKQRWIVQDIEGNTVPSATVSEELVVVGSSKVGSNLAVRRGGNNDVTNTHIAWRSGEATATFSSPLVYHGHVYMVNRVGVAFCLDAKTGETVWKQRIGESCWASPLGACGRIYFFGKSGATTVIAAGKELKILAKNLLPTEDRVYGVAAVEGLIIIRTGSKLVCISGDKDNRAEDTMQTSDEVRPGNENYAALPKPITSFGAAVLGDNLYVYGGHYGKAHHYYEQGQSGELLCLTTKEPAQWKVAATGPRLQGLALAAHRDVLYRIGGFEARNQEDEEQDLWSVADFVRFSPQTEKWEDVTPMPSPRSSFDAAIIGDVLYVVGGWSMQGGKETVWHETAYSIDLAKDSAQWQELLKPGFQRRALSVGTSDGKLYVIGGMQADGKVTRRTAVFDPAAGVWSEGPKLPGEDMEGFGAACCTLGGRLHVSTSSGKLLRLAKDGRAWEELRTLGSGRFFHRMLPIGDARLISLGGANMETGKFSDSEVVDLR